ncbi:MAG: ACT domain-containing protein, partial [Cyanobacteria bacterium P01_E01_bin.48]
MAALTPSSSFSVTLKLRLPNRAGMLAKVTQAIAAAGGNLGRIDLLDRVLTSMVRAIEIDATSTEHAEQIVQAVRMVPDIEVLEVDDLTFDLHRSGKISVEAKVGIHTPSELAMAYTPGVGRISTAIARNPEMVYDLTIKGNSVGIVTDGSAVLGLGNIGPEAALPVMEGKAMLFKQFADIDAFPMCLATQDVDEVVQAVSQLLPVF